MKYLGFNIKVHIFDENINLRKYYYGCIQI